jgi:peptidoglycan/xylan/chitin deacetylase (PgdA/CDA1 family)
VTGAAVRWARPPYGTASENYAIVARELGLKTALWDISPRDWSCPTRFELLSELLTGELEGKVILLHDGSGDPMVTADCVDYLIPRLRSAGVRPITLTEFHATDQFSKPSFSMASNG